MTSKTGEKPFYLYLVLVSFFQSEIVARSFHFLSIDVRMLVNISFFQLDYYLVCIHVSINNSMTSKNRTKKTSLLYIFSVKLLQHSYK